jgi:hypothetical protein
MKNFNRYFPLISLVILSLFKINYHSSVCLSG